ncbi:sensor histidine kinase [Botryobacter ruber]|uniref:sensor histidine kinase n=1 Tax=Botryobacter ruber TaxID=2171629 RepID=UPI000E0C9248|nr:HAMP domain-containing sensor histidine kinase [Botryobacter ruber]
MKLINHTILFLSLILFVTITLWAVLFYFQLLEQVKTTVDEGLANYKIVVIDKLKDRTPIVQHESLQENHYLVRKIDEAYALQVRDSYKDTLIFSDLKNEYYQARLLTTAFVSTDGNFYEMKVVSQALQKGDLVKKVISSLLWVCLFMFVCTIVVNRFVLTKTWKPFYQVLNYINAFRLDKGAELEMDKTRIEEFSLLNKSIRNLLKNNVEIYESQKQFIENASHELQTPLAIGINKLELLAEDSNLSPEQLQKIGSIIEMFQRLASLNKSLLLISKIENNQFQSAEAVSFDHLFSRMIQDFNDFASYQQIQISYVKEADWEMNMNKDLAEILVMNLLKNAIVHNHPHGEIIIRLSASFFTIENTSHAPAIQADKLFRRFHKNSKSHSSTGLGLAIVKSIADVANLAVAYTYNGRHSFKVSEKPL